MAYKRTVKSGKKKLDGKAIKVITSAIKHEDSRSRHPKVSFLLLCSPAIGDQIKALEALDRRGRKTGDYANAYADIKDYIEFLQQEKKLRAYPVGLIEAAYTISAGNFGWLNVIKWHIVINIWMNILKLKQERDIRVSFLCDHPV